MPSPPAGLVPQTGGRSRWSSAASANRAARVHTPLLTSLFRFSCASLSYAAQTCDPGDTRDLSRADPFMGSFFFKSIEMEFIRMERIRCFVADRRVLLTVLRGSSEKLVNDWLEKLAGYEITRVLFD